MPLVFLIGGCLAPSLAVITYTEVSPEELSFQRPVIPYKELNYFLLFGSMLYDLPRAKVTKARIVGSIVNQGCVCGLTAPCSAPGRQALQAAELQHGQVPLPRHLSGPDPFVMSSIVRCWNLSLDSQLSPPSPFFHRIANCRNKCHPTSSFQSPL